MAERAPTPGASGMGDPYFPQDGNGGIDVLHYDVRDGYSEIRRPPPALVTVMQQPDFPM